MNREDILKDMKELVGKKDPIVFFEKMVDVMSLLFDRIDKLETNLKAIKTNSALSIEWDPRVAGDMLAKQIDELRKNRDVYHTELTACKIAYAENKITQEYATFVNFWMDTLGWHPFLDYQV